jgi:quercetin dioxygenase-like cupin family protein
MNKENIFSKSGIASKKAKTHYFTGQVSAKDISAVIKPTTEKIYHVTFKNGSRTKLHYHDGGQTLIVTDGYGSLIIYQKTGKTKENFSIKITKKIKLKTGDCVHIPAMKFHTHGSINKKINFSHIAINSFPRKNKEPKTIWYESDFKRNVTKMLK